MAITTTGDLSFSNLSSEQIISTYNPCLIEFSSSVSGGVRAEVDVFPVGSTAFTTIHLTANTNEVFNFDFNGVIKDIVNESDNYLETSYTFPDISTLSNALFIDNKINTTAEWEVRIYDASNVLLDLAGSGGYSFVKASTQVGNSPVMNDYTAIVGTGGGFFYSLLESQLGVIAWEGFPIDIQFDANNSTGQVVDLNGVLFTGAFTPTEDERVLRLCLIDDNGNELTGLSNNNTNNIEVLLIGGGGNSTIIPVDYKEVSTPDCSKYFRYKNIKGGDSFFLFEDAFQTQVDRKNKSNIIRNFDNLTTARSRNLSLGNNNNELLICHHLATTELENSLLQGLALSPVIELWLGGNKWQRVNLVSSPPELNSKQEPTNYALTFDLGVKYNQSI